MIKTDLGGLSYEIDCASIELKNISSCAFFCNEKGVLHGLILEIPQGKIADKFEGMVKDFSKKYELISNEVNPVGDKLALFKNGNSFVDLKQPHMSNLKITYKTKKLQDIATEKIKQDNLKEEEKQRKLL